MNKVNYTKNIPYVLNNHIYEYDISKANINILYYYGEIDEKEYSRLCTVDRMVRQKEIGIMELNDRWIYDVIKNGVLEMRKNLIIQNNILDDNILSCKNDAIFIIGQQPQITKFENIEFKLKNVYTSFFNLNRLEFYYFRDQINNKEKLDVKGISDKKLKLHEPFMLDFFKAVFETIDYDIQEAIMMIRSFYNQLITNNLELGYYRNFDSESLFRIILDGSIYDLEDTNPNNIPYINKDCNLNILRELWGILSGIILNN